MKTTTMAKRIVILYFLVLFTGTSLFGQSYNVTLTEAKTFADKLETTVSNGDAAIFFTALYFPELSNRITAKSNVAKNPGVMLGFRQGLERNDMGRQIIANVQNGSYRLVNTYQQSGQTHALFRMFGNGGLNYHDFLLCKDKDSVKVADIYVYLTGEYLSITFAELLNTLVPGTSSISDSQERTNFINNLRTLQRQGEYATMKNMIEKQSPEMKNNKAIQTFYILACKNVDTESYISSIESFAALYPDASNIYLIMLDAYYLKKEVEKGIDAINKLDTLVKGDPFLNFYRGNFYILGEKPDDAKAAFEKAFQYDPSFAQNMQQLVVTYAGKGNYDKANEVIEKYKKTKDFKQTYIDQLYDAIPDLKKK